ncbi:MAG: PSD1 and planctomycete cytochrome C domain-containing protein [Acidobacteriota bacterium]|nr:PSD1 and planctomycete cytochrome C domain-containing protein [Acidobacteriota bacterium]
MARSGFVPAFVLLTGVAASAQTAKTISFGADIAPILAEKCIQCHGQDSTMGNLDLRTRAGMLKGGKHGPAIVAGKGMASGLYGHLTGTVQPQMPLGGRLSAEQIALLKQWIDGGAVWDTPATLTSSTAPAEKKFTARQRTYWAFQPVAKAAAPAVKDSGFVRTPIDAFVLARLEQKKLKPNPPADKVTLLRRATLDLIGLTPTPEEVQAFLADDSPDAFAKVVDRLLASPQYGERWGRHWLDLARYADTNGFKSDETRPNIWRYRDYVIQSFNDDKPYDRFIKEQIAGDELYPGEPAAKIAVGFNRHYTDETNQPVMELRRQETLNDITDTVASVFMGLTYGCARCHDHKFDPILHKDYYRLQAFFANIRAEDDAVLLSGDKLETYKRQLAEWEAKTGGIRREMHALVEPIGKAKADFYSIRFSKGTREALNAAPEKRTPLQAILMFDAMPQITYRDDALAKELKPEQKKRFEELQAELKKYESEKPRPPLAQTVVDNGCDAPPSYVLAGGNWDAPKQQVQPGFLSILDPSNPKIVAKPELNSTGRRSVLANWLADPKNPLTPRVMVNRIWNYHFGAGIAGTPSDFGVMGERPTNPQLLDYLAATFIENGWSVKKMHRMIMLSSVYQESSAFQSGGAAADPEDKLLWRYPRHRIEGEALRDSMLLTSGMLNPKMGGPGVHPPLPPGTVPMRYGGWTPEKDVNEANRRSVYVFEKRTMTYPMFEAFDAPNPQDSCPRRFRTVIPSQSLQLMNDGLVLKWSQALASRVLNDGGLQPTQQIGRAFHIVLSREPQPREEKEILTFLDEQSTLIAGRLANHEKVPLPENLPSGMEPARVGAFVDFCHALLNSNEFLYVN